MDMDVGIILLAAGSSSRMGTSKQLLDVHGTPLLTHSAGIAVQSGIGEVVVVLGANEREHRKTLRRLPVEIVVNQLWQRGMGGSLKAGLNHLLAMKPSIQSVLVMVCDQPLLTSDHLKKLYLKHQESNSPITASRYSEVNGVPAIFAKSLFPSLAALADDHGAKKIIDQLSDQAASVEFTGGEIDLDTPEDYKKINL